MKHIWIKFYDKQIESETYIRYDLIEQLYEDNEGNKKYTRINSGDDSILVKGSVDSVRLNIDFQYMSQLGIDKK